MADAPYVKGINALAAAGINLTSDTIKVVACDSSYTANMSSDQYLSAIDSGARIATATLSSKSFTDGVFDAADPTFTAVASGDTITQLVIYKDSGSPSTSALIWRIDSYTGLPYATDNGDIVLAWPNDANKIFKIGA